MRRRQFLFFLATATSLPLSARAQPGKAAHRIGFLGLGTAESWQPRVEALTNGLRYLFVELSDKSVTVCL